MSSKCAAHIELEPRHAALREWCVSRLPIRNNRPLPPTAMRLTWKHPDCQPDVEPPKLQALDTIELGLPQIEVVCVPLCTTFIPVPEQCHAIVSKVLI